MSVRFNSSDFVQGWRECLPILLAVCAFAMLFGATGVNNGLTANETLLSSAVVFAGASQFVFLELYGLKAPVWSVLVAVFAVNFRHVLYSASVGRYMGGFSAISRYVSFFFLADPVFGAAEQRAQKPGLTPSFYFGYAIPLYCCWLVFTLIGILFGALIDDPGALGLDMLLSIYFISLLMGFRSRSNWLPVVIASGIASVLFYQWFGAPWHITLGALVGIGVAVIRGKPEVETVADDG